MSGPQNLRISYVWQDEVMADKVLAEPGPVTLGQTDAVTFTTPDVGLPPGFAILRPGSRGYVLTLGASMSGRVSIGGKEMDVGEFMSQSSGERVAGKGGFKASSVAPGDWGVIHLDDGGEHSFFFHFVKSDPPIPRAGWKDSELLLPALAFSVIMHGVLIAYMFTIGRETPRFTFPGKRDLVADYLLNRPPPRVIEPEVPETRAGTEDGDENEKPASTVGKEAKSGGEGEKERQRAKDPDKGEPDEALPERVQTGLLSKKSRNAINKVRNRGGFDKRLGKTLARLDGLTNDGSSRGTGPGSGTGVGEGKGTGTTTKGDKRGVGGGGTAHADVRTQGKLDTGGKRAAKGRPGGSGVKEVAVKVRPGKPSGNFGGLTPEQILKVVKSRARAIKTCYQRELQRTKGLGGKIVVSWRVDSGGRVQRARVTKTTMRNGRVEDCVVRQVQNMKFPSPKGGGTARVNFPFIFGH